MQYTFYDGIDPKSKVVAITGANRGLGFEMARLFSINGMKVYMLGRNFIACDNAAGAIRDYTGDSVYPISLKMDVTNSQAINSTFDKIVEKEGKIDVLINNAAVFASKNFSDTTFEEFREMFKVNLDGPFIICKKVFEIMKNQKSGTILNINSTGGFEGYGLHSAYCSSKHALLGFTEALSKEGDEHNIKVYSLCPTIMNTEMGRTAVKVDDTQAKNLLQPTDVANIALFMILFSAKTGFIDNITVRGNYGQLRFF